MAENEKTLQQITKIQKLSNFQIIKDVKMPLASSLYEIGSIIGPEQSKQDLFPALDFILKDPSDKIKLSAIQHLAKFVEQF